MTHHPCCSVLHSTLDYDTLFLSSSVKVCYSYGTMVVAACVVGNAVSTVTLLTRYERT